MSKAAQILTALGGAENVEELEPCITRLRVKVSDVDKLDDDALRATGAFGVIRSGRIIQVVVGPEADALAADIDALRPWPGR
jgi:PTS system N-acetylglucosamine-specific IIB component